MGCYKTLDPTILPQPFAISHKQQTFFLELELLNLATCCFGKVVGPEYVLWYFVMGLVSRDLSGKVGRTSQIHKPYTVTYQDDGLAFLEPKF